MKPLIGVTTSELRPSSAGTLRRHGEPPHAEMALGMTYLRAIEEALLARLRGRALCSRAYLSSHTDSKLTLSPRMKT